VGAVASARGAGAGTSEVSGVSVAATASELATLVGVAAVSTGGTTSAAVEEGDVAVAGALSVPFVVPDALTESTVSVSPSGADSSRRDVKDRRDRVPFDGVVVASASTTAGAGGASVSGSATATASALVVFRRGARLGFGFSAVSASETSAAFTASMLGSWESMNHRQSYAPTRRTRPGNRRVTEQGKASRSIETLRGAQVDVRADMQVE
jgi:hypothetical protein